MNILSVKLFCQDMLVLFKPIRPSTKLLLTFLLQQTIPCVAVMGSIITVKQHSWSIYD